MGGGRLRAARAVALAGLFRAAGAWAGPPDVLVRADRVLLEAGALRAEGQVEIELGEQRIRGELLGLWEMEGRLVVIHGELQREDLGELRFGRAEIDTTTGVIRLSEVHLIGPNGLRASAEELQLHADERVTARQLQLTTCDCAQPPPWTVHAARASLEEQVVRFSGGRVDLLGLPLLPLPLGEVPLQRRSGLLPPELATGVNGVQLGLPLYLVLGRSADVSLTPELLTARGGRLNTELRWAQPKGEGIVEGSLGYDTVEAGVRGAARWDQAAHRGPSFAATRGQLVSDLPYLADYGDGFLSRRQPWGELRTALGWGPVELSVHGFQAPEIATHRLVGMGLYQPARELGGGWLGAATARGEVLGRAPELWTVSEADFAGEVSSSITRPSWLGPLRLTPEARVGSWGSSLESPEAAGWGLAGAELALPAWRPHAQAHERVELSLRGAAGRAVGEVEAAPPTWLLAPGLGYRYVGRRSSVEARTAVAGTPEGWAWTGDAQGGSEALSGWAQLQAVPWPWAPVGGLEDLLHLASVGLRGALRRVSLGGGWVYARPEAIRQPDPEEEHAVHQLRASGGVGLPGALSPLELSAGSSYDLDGLGFISRRVGLRWRHPTGCLGLSAEAELAVDRPLPDVALRLDVVDVPR